MPSGDPPAPPPPPPEPYTGISAEGDGLVRFITEADTARYGQWLRSALDAWPCAQPVTDATFADFQFWVGSFTARRLGFPEDDILLIATDLGRATVEQGSGSLRDNGFVSDGTGRILGLQRCVNRLQTAD
jgi:hypothetical protein